MGCRIPILWQTQIASQRQMVNSIFSCRLTISSTLKTPSRHSTSGRECCARGTLFLILPHGDRTLDRHRAKTTLQHHIDDFTTLTDRPDRSHIEEITAGWSANEDAEAAGIVYEREWGAHRWDWDFRFENDVIHFHVWTQDEIVRLLQYLNFKIIFVDEFVPERTDSFVVVARKAEV